MVLGLEQPHEGCQGEEECATHASPRVVVSVGVQWLAGSPGSHSPQRALATSVPLDPPPIVCYLRNPSITIELIGIPINILIEI